MKPAGIEQSSSDIAHSRRDHTAMLTQIYALPCPAAQTQTRRAQ
jgi:hypothetical protein